jgi:hypothetical protein
VRWPPACEDVNPEAEDRPLLEDITKLSSEDRITTCGLKCPINPITNPNSVYSHVTIYWRRIRVV